MECGPCSALSQGLCHVPSRSPNSRLDFISLPNTIQSRNARRRREWPPPRRALAFWGQRTLPTLPPAEPLVILGLSQWLAAQDGSCGWDTILLSLPPGSLGKHFVSNHSRPVNISAHDISVCILDVCMCFIDKQMLSFVAPPESKFVPPYC